MDKEGSVSPDGFEALRARFQEQSRRAQAYYTVMHTARDIAGSDDAASAWMNEALEALGGKTPAQLVGEGREDEVLRHLASLRPGAPG